MIKNFKVCDCREKYIAEDLKKDKNKKIIIAHDSSIIYSDLIHYLKEQDALKDKTFISTKYMFNTENKSPTMSFYIVFQSYHYNYVEKDVTNLYKEFMLDDKTNVYLYIRQITNSITPILSYINKHFPEELL